MNWFEETSEGVLLRIKAQPNASKSEIAGLYGEPPRLKIRIASAPIEGQANKELIRFLSKLLELAPSKLKLVRGDTSSKKDIQCSDVSVERIKNLGEQRHR